MWRWTVTPVMTTPTHCPDVSTTSRNVIMTKYVPSSMVTVTVLPTSTVKKPTTANERQKTRSATALEAESPSLAPPTTAQDTSTTTPTPVRSAAQTPSVPATSCSSLRWRPSRLMPSYAQVGVLLTTCRNVSTEQCAAGKDSSARSRERTVKSGENVKMITNTTTAQMRRTTTPTSLTVKTTTTTALDTV